LQYPQPVCSMASALRHRRLPFASRSSSERTGEHLAINAFGTNYNNLGGDFLIYTPAQSNVWTVYCLISKTTQRQATMVADKTVVLPVCQKPVWVQHSLGTCCALTVKSTRNYAGTKVSIPAHGLGNCEEESQLYLLGAFQVTIHILDHHILDAGDSLLTLVPILSPTAETTRSS
jgi:hypothetical protein